MSYIPEYHENYYRVEGTAYNQGKIGIGTINPVQLLHVSGGNIRLDGTGFFNGDLNVTGNLNVYGTTAQFAVSQVIAEDKSLELNVATGTAIGGGNYTTAAFSDDAGANDGGIVIKSTSLDSTRGVQDKVILYRNSTPASGFVTNQRWTVSGNYGKNTLQLSDATANVGMTIGTDANSVNLYRSTNDTLKTDDNLIVDLDLTVNGNTTLGDVTTDTITFNARSASDLTPSTNNTRNLGSSALNWSTAYVNTLQVAANSTLTGDLSVQGNTTLGDTNTDATVIRGITKIADSSQTNGILFGTANASYDTNLYRSGANILRTDDAFVCQGFFSGIGSGAISDGVTAIQPLASNPLSVVGSGNTYVQVNIQNLSSGDNASADLVITANNGTDTTNFINLGINNSGYNQAAFSNGTGYDGYLFIDGGNLDIGTKTPGKILEFHAGGSIQEKTIARINESGFAVVSGYTFSTVNTGVTAGTNNQGQGLLTNQVNIITSNPNSPGGVTLPIALSGLSNRIMIRNTATNSVNVYPNVGAKIDGLTANLPFAPSIIQSTQKEFYSAGTGQWYSI
jgi:hypothetical protein